MFEGDYYDYNAALDIGECEDDGDGCVDGEGDDRDDGDEQAGKEREWYLSAYGGDKYAATASSPAPHTTHTAPPII